MAAGCSYDFGGGSGSGGAGTSAVSASSTDASTSEASSASNAESSTAIVTAATTTAEASSSSGAPDLAPCERVDAPGQTFVETFDDAQAPERWQQEKEGGNGTATVADGAARIDIGNSNAVLYASKAEIVFSECRMVVEQTSATQQAIELVAIRAGADDDTAFVLRYVSKGAQEPEAQGHVLIDGELSGKPQVKTLPRRRLMRLETSGTEIRAMVGDDGSTWETIYLGERPDWMNASARLVLGVRRSNADMTGVGTFDNVNAF